MTRAGLAVCLALALLVGVGLGYEVTKRASCASAALHHFARETP